MSSKVTPIHAQARSSAGPQLIAEFKSCALESITDLLDAMFDGADDALFKISENADNNLHQGVYFDAMRAVRLARPQITQTFVQTLSQVMQHGEPSNPARAVVDMSLVPAAELEETVAVANMISKAGGLLRIELAPLQARLQTLAEKHPGVIEPKGLAPSGLCHSFREAMAPVDFEIEIKLLIYKLFERSVMAEIGATYRHLDDFLKQRDVAPKAQAAVGANGGAFARQKGRGQDWSERLQGLQRQVTPENQFGTDEVINLLEQVDFDKAGQDYAPDELIDTLLALLRVEQTDSAPRTLARKERRLIGMVTAMFNNLHAEGELNSASRDLLARTRVPVMKTALIDPQFFRDPDHPARRLVNEIATLNAIAPAEDAELYAQAASLVDRLVSEFERDPGVLETVADELQDLGVVFVKSRETSFQRQALLERAKRVALLEIRQQALGRRVAEAMHPFLLKGWGPLMAYQYIKHGLDSPQWRQAGQVLTQILDAAGLPGADTDRAARAQQQTELLALVRQELRQLSMRHARVTELVAGLESTFASVLESHPSAEGDNDEDMLAQLASWAPAEEQVFDDQGHHDATQAAFASVLNEASLTSQGPDSDVDERMQPQAQGAQADSTSDSNAEPEQLSNGDAASLVEAVCAPGTWFQLYTGSERMRWLRYRDYDPVTQLVSFVNRDNKIVYERDVLEFGEDLRAKRSQPIYERDEFERKLEEIISMQIQPKS